MGRETRSSSWAGTDGKVAGREENILGVGRDLLFFVSFGRVYLFSRVFGL